jgi:hypothetical protein
MGGSLSTNVCVGGEKVSTCLPSNPACIYTQIYYICGSLSLVFCVRYSTGRRAGVVCLSELVILSDVMERKKKETAARRLQ